MKYSEEEIEDIIDELDTLLEEYEELSDIEREEDEDIIEAIVDLREEFNDFYDLEEEDQEELMEEAQAFLFSMRLFEEALDEEEFQGLESFLEGKDEGELSKKITPELIELFEEMAEDYSSSDNKKIASNAKKLAEELKEILYNSRGEESSDFDFDGEVCAKGSKIISLADR